VNLFWPVRFRNNFCNCDSFWTFGSTNLIGDRSVAKPALTEVSIAQGNADVHQWLYENSNLQFVFERSENTRALDRPLVPAK
jgi:hypothetical protein